MKKIKIYLDTSVISFLYADDSPDFKKITSDFFENYVKKNVYDTYISQIVINELQKTINLELKKKLLSVLKNYELTILPESLEAEKLAREYVNKGVIPESKTEDALHIALTTIHEIDILLSWNFKHLANFNKQIKIKIINEQNGYFYPLTLTNPMEVFDDRHNT